MGLLRDEGPPAWHPANNAMKEAARKAARIAADSGSTLADLASRFAFRGLAKEGFDATVIGFAKKEELESAVECSRSVESQGAEERAREEKIIKDVVGCFEEIGMKDFAWESPTKKDMEG